MTYRELADKILLLNKKQQDMDVTIHDTWSDEFFPIQDCFWFACDNHDILDVDQPILRIQ
jgi:hypothetical protein